MLVYYLGGHVIGGCKKQKKSSLLSYNSHVYEVLATSFS